MRALARPWTIGLIAGAAVLAISYAGVFVWAKTYEQRLAPNLWLGAIEVGGDNIETARQKINTQIDKIILEGLQLSVDGTLGAVPFAPISTETADYVSFDADKALKTALSAYHSETPLFQPLLLLFSLTHKTKIKIAVTLDEERLKAAVLNAFPDSVQPAINADFAFALSPSGEAEEEWRAAVTPSSKGLAISLDSLFLDIIKQLNNLETQPIVLTREVIKPTIGESDLEPLITTIESAINNAPYTISYEEKEWVVKTEDIIASLQPILKKEAVTVEISAEKLSSLLDEIAAVVEKPVVDARLTVENGRVTDFQASSEGIAIDRGALANALTETIFLSGNKTVELTVVISKPSVEIGNLNDLGINEVLGIGTSNYKGSPANRIKNIRNGVRLLNGLLIKPGEEFSLLNPLRPFNTENGYLPELVIKGDKIEPEIGGGLCQLGTTTFRAAMNSGLPITARSNHSLVVRYYSDPTNGNPGTDATIYDPAPDFKFINDTGHYLFFQAEMDEANYALRFSFWGTSDGRKGSYAPPTLIRWIPVGDEQKIETTDLEPGKEKCQEAHIGADASFVYTIERPDGTKEETTYDSHYRPLPKICLVGVEELTPATEEAATETTVPLTE